MIVKKGISAGAVVIGLLFIGAVMSGLKTVQKDTNEGEVAKKVLDQVKEGIRNDSLIAPDSVFVESGFTVDTRKTDREKVDYFISINYFDTLRYDECTLVLIPKTASKLLKQQIQKDSDSLRLKAEMVLNNLRR